jgi:hypothetical protein
MAYQAMGRRSIPNYIKADASDIDQLYDTGSVDQVVGHTPSPSTWRNFPFRLAGRHLRSRSGCATFPRSWVLRDKKYIRCLCNRGKVLPENRHFQ